MPKPVFQDPIERSALWFLCALSTAGIVWTIGYLLFDLNAFVEIAGIVAAAVVTWGLSRRTTNGTKVPGKPDLFFVLATIAGDLLILIACLHARTDLALSSPWLVVSPAVFVIFAATTFSGMLSRSRVATFFHFFTAFSIATTIFKIGFGFDPFVHRAAETALAAAGHIDPKTPLYAGQYAIVAIVHRLLGISVDALDKWLVPLLASMLIPILGIAGLRDGWGMTDEAARRWIYLFLVTPFAALTFSVPYNLTVVLFILVLCLSPLCSDRRIAAGLAIVAAWSVLCHPLLGVPTAIFAAYSIANGHVRHSVRNIVATVLLAVSVPALLALNNYRVHASTVINNPFSRLDFFWGLFADPFPHPPGIVPTFWTGLYLYHQWLPAILLVATIVVAVCTSRRRAGSRPTAGKTDLSTVSILFLGLLGSIFLVSTAFVFQDIISYEQSEFALRLVEILPLVLLPTLGVGSEAVWQFVAARRPLLAPPLLVPVAIAASLSLYFSYPQTNPKSDLSGPSVSAADVEAVHAIDELADGQPYFVLANQMTSAAALREFGFAHYLPAGERQTLWYPLPTGAALYDLYGQMTYGEPTIETMRAAAALTETNRGYFLTYRYWPGFEWLDERARGISGAWYAVGDGAIIMYEFDNLLVEPDSYANQD
ncbi:MAG: hypothetical protein WCO25_00065 [Candidatus Uhrbacteria bacterium]